MRRITITAVSILGATLALGASAVTAVAHNETPGQKISSDTTLDACGYFSGTQTANNTNHSGASYSENGTWTGVNNTYDGPVASLGNVHGSYTMSYTDTSATTWEGTELFRSNAGKITQIFSFDGTQWSVSVTATGDLSFLTSDTNGECYTGPYPRP